MRTRALVGFVVVTACGSPPPPPSQAPPERETTTVRVTWTRVVAGGPLELSIRDRVAEHEGTVGAVFRLTNHGDTPLVVDLRSLDRVARPEAPAGLRSPLSDAQIEELAAVSALSQVGAGAAIEYAVPFTCPEGGETEIGGTMAATDRGRTVELVADGAHARLVCDPAPAAGAIWVTAGGGLTAPGIAAADFGEGTPDLVRAADVSHAGEVALLPFSYDPRPIERWRYDACVAVGTCPARSVPQPPGSIRAPAVGMSAAGVAAFCAARALRPLSPEEDAVAGSPGRALLEGDVGDVERAGFRCARSEAAPAASP